MPVSDMPPDVNIDAESAWVVSAQIAEQKKAANVLKRLQGRLPNTPMTDAEVTPMDGIYAIQTKDGPTIYTDGSGTYLIIGVVFDLNTGKALHGNAGAPVSKIE